MPSPLYFEGVGPNFLEALQQLVNAHVAEISSRSERIDAKPTPKTFLPLVLKSHEILQKTDQPSGDYSARDPSAEHNAWGMTKSSTSTNASTSLSERQQKLVHVFQALDGDNSGTLSSDELRRALRIMGLPNARVVKMLRMADHDRSGVIEISEWTSVLSRTDMDEFAEFLEVLDVEKILPKLQTMEEEERPKDEPRWVFAPSSPARILWDLLVMVSCIFVAIEFPFILAWEDDISDHTLRALNIPEHTVDVILVFDILFNFFTGYYDDCGKLIVDHAMVAKHYLETWFFVDFISSIPFDVISGSGVNTQLLKVLKFWKILRVFKMLKIGGLEISDVSDFWSDVALSKIAHTIQRRSSLLLYMLLACHWMACGMKLVDEGFLTDFEDGSYKSQVWSEYLVAWYWAMTTLTTVGYGDITPDTQKEILYVTFSMVIGGTFYGYVVGTIASMVASTDLNATAYYERMEIVHAWLAHHGLPHEMKRRLRRYFKFLMERQSAANESDLWRDLTQELQIEVGEYVVRDTVKSNPLFDRLGLGAVVQLQSVVKHITMEATQRVTTFGEVGTAMYMIDKGLLKWERPTIDGRKGGSGSMGPGESFGEEILLGFREDYDYTIDVVKLAKLEVIEERDFLTVFQCMPRVLERMRRNALAMDPEWKEPDRLELGSDT